VVIGTHSTQSSGIEISDLTIDANHDRLTSSGGVPLNLEGIKLRSDQGGHWIHNVNVIGGSGDVGALDIVFETFAVHIWGNAQSFDPQENTGSIIEHVTVSKPGHAVINGSPEGGAIDGIVINNAVAEIRDNLVDGYGIGYSGWSMGPVNFHDNIARNVVYGFNLDSFSNSGVIVKNNQFIHPSSYGIVIGGGGPSMPFANGSITGNTIKMNRSNTIAVVLRGQVESSVFSGNTITADAGQGQLAIWSYPALTGVSNTKIVFQDNHIDRTLGINFSQDPKFNTYCRFQNRDLQGKALPDFPDNSSATCN
jgi:hypothetical protein